MLVAGSGSGSPLVIHGPAIHRELQLWSEAGIPAKTALTAATANAARRLGISGRAGMIRKGYDATLLILDGNPLADIAATERISAVFSKGERVRRGSLFDQK
jgi:imidazolonepropionase-like amidohydrolase